GARHPACAAALKPAFAVVPAARERPTKRVRAGIEARAARVVPDPSEPPPFSALELALEQHVTDHAPLARDGVEGKKADAGHVLAVKAAVAAAEELVSAADREE